MTTTTAKKPEKVLVQFTQACAPYAKGEVAALPAEMAQTVLQPQGTRPAVAELYKGGKPAPRDRSGDGTSSVDTLRRRADKAEGALSVALDKVEDLQKAVKK